MTPATPSRPAPQAANARSDGFIALDASHRQFLDAVDALERLIPGLERDGATPSNRASAAGIAKTLAQASEHHEDEERHVFPALLGGADEALADVVRRLHQDHGWLEENWLELGPHLQALASGYGGWDIDTLRAGAPVIAALLRDHIALEESVAYPQARARLSAESRREIGREMAARHRAARHAAHPRG